jgi:hypothetical protein
MAMDSGLARRRAPRNDERIICDEFPINANKKTRHLHRDFALYTVVIPGRREAASPESIIAGVQCLDRGRRSRDSISFLARKEVDVTGHRTDGGYGFRARVKTRAPERRANNL